jgi:hypothetical protein
MRSGFAYIRATPPPPCIRKLKNRLFLANFSRRAFTMVEVIFVIVMGQDKITADLS